MTKFTTTVGKRDGQWTAESNTVIEGTNRELTIRTARDYNGVVRSTATVFRVEGTFKTHAMGFGSASGDFSKAVLSMRHPRATEKVIRLQHETAMAQAESILFQVQRHYDARDQLVEAGVEASTSATAAHADEVVA